MHLLRRAAVGLLLAVLLSAVSVSVASARAVPLPGNAATGSNLNAWLNATACPTAGGCVAVGGFFDSANNLQALVENQVNGTWSSSPVDVSGLGLSNVSQPYLYNVSCASAGNCVAVGYVNGTDSNHSSGDHALIATETDGVWSASLAPEPPGYVSGGSLEAIECPSAGNCVAAGAYLASGYVEEGLIETETNGVWSASEAPMPGSPTYPQPDLYGVSCSAVGDCTIVGDYEDANYNYQALILTDSQGTWSASSPDLSALAGTTAPLASLYSVSCPSAGSCTAVGRYEDSGSLYHALVIDEVGGVWRQPAAAALPSDAMNSIVSGSGQSNVWLNSVSCASAGNCTAVGSYDATDSNSTSTGPDVAPLVLTETGGNWSQGMRPALPADALGGNASGVLDSVTCSAPGACVAGGSYANAAGHNAALITRLSAGSWSPAGVDEGTAYWGPYDNWVNVSCSQSGYCASAGYTQDKTSSNDAPVLLNAPAAPSGPSASANGTQATVSWGAPTDDGGLPLTGYAVSASDATNSARGGQSGIAAGTAGSAVLTGLAAGDTYGFTVTPLSLLGSGLSATTSSIAIPVPVAVPPVAEPVVVNPAVIPAVRRGPAWAQVYRSLRVLLVPRGVSGRLPRLRRTHGYVFSYRALEAGRVSVRWYEVVGRGKRRHRVLVGSGVARPRRAVRVQLDLHLSRFGRRQVASGERPRLIAVVAFVGRGVHVSRRHVFGLG